MRDCQNPGCYGELVTWLVAVPGQPARKCCLGCLSDTVLFLGGVAVIVTRLED